MPHDAQTSFNHQETIQRRFEEFHRLNPRVYELLARFAKQLRERGYRHAGIKFLVERVRWEIMMTTADPASEFKINNNYTSRYARLLMLNEPSLRGFFELRRLRAF